MKTSTLIIIGGAGVAVVYLATRPTTPAVPLGYGVPTSTNSLLGNLGAFLGGAIVGGGGVAKAPASIGTVSSGSSSSASVSQGITPQEVASLDAANVAAYDAQGSPDAPVYGVAGIDY
jgi:hypothetical protein